MQVALFMACRGKLVIPRALGTGNTSGLGVAFGEVRRFRAVIPRGLAAGIGALSYFIMGSEKGARRGRFAFNELAAIVLAKKSRLF
jgi:hypothetical protein